MPQAIPELREKLLAAARKRMLHNPPIPFTMRELSKDCGAALGTAYNYFSSREELMATVMLADWHLSVKAMNSAVDKSDNILDAVHGIYDAIHGFYTLYEPTFKSYTKQTNPTQMLKDNHRKVVDQVQIPMDRAVTRFDCKFDEHLPMILSEALIYASHEELGLDLVWPIIVKIFS